MATYDVSALDRRYPKLSRSNTGRATGAYVPAKAGILIDKVSVSRITDSAFAESASKWKTASKVADITMITVSAAYLAMEALCVAAGLAASPIVVTSFIAVCGIGALTHLSISPK